MVTFLQNANESIMTETRPVVVLVWGNNGEGRKKDNKGTSEKNWGMMHMFTILTVVMFSQMHKYIKIYHVIQFIFV